MKTETMTMTEFETTIAANAKRAPCGANKALLKRCETQPVKLTFETVGKAVSKQTALYVVRRNLTAQVRIIRRNAELFIGPGEYVPSERVNSK